MVMSEGTIFVLLLGKISRESVKIPDSDSTPMLSEALHLSYRDDWLVVAES